jgi:hypothetical protein
MIAPMMVYIGPNASSLGFTVMPKPPNETEDPKFQGIVQHFLKTPPKPHAPLKGKPKTSRASSKRSSPKTGGGKP